MSRLKTRVTGLQVISTGVGPRVEDADASVVVDDREHDGAEHERLRRLLAVKPGALTAAKKLLVRARAVTLPQTVALFWVMTFPFERALAEQLRASCASTGPGR